MTGFIKQEYESFIKITFNYSDGTTSEEIIQKPTRQKTAASYARWDDDVATTNAELDSNKKQSSNNNTTGSQDTSD